MLAHPYATEGGQGGFACVRDTEYQVMSQCWEPFSSLDTLINQFFIAMVLSATQLKLPDALIGRLVLVTTGSSKCRSETPLLRRVRNDSAGNRPRVAEEIISSTF